MKPDMVAHTSVIPVILWQDGRQRQNPQKRVAFGSPLMESGLNGREGLWVVTTVGLFSMEPWPSLFAGICAISD